MKIIAVCGMGFGTSLMVKMTMDDILNEIGLKAEVEASDIGSIKGKTADLFVTSAEMQYQFSDIESDIIFLKNMTDKQEIRKKLLAYLDHKAKG